MSLIDNLTRQAGRIANDLQGSLRKARIEGERRLIQRQHRAALEELGERTFELVKAGEIPAGPLAVEIAAVDRKLEELEQKTAELQVEPEEAAAPQPTEATGEGGVGNNGAGGPGPGWEAAERFFRTGD